MNIPPDDNNPPAGIDPSLPPDLNLSSGGGSGKTLFLIIGVVVAAGVGFFVWQSKKTLEERKQHAAFMEHFQAWEKDDLLKFWSCVLGPNTDGAVLPSPDIITQKIDVQFASDFRNFPKKVTEDCKKAAKDAADKLNTLGALPQYQPALDAYAKSIMGITEALDDWAKVAPDQVNAKTIGKNAEDYGNAWHAYQGGAPAPEVIAYDAFLHCADADLEKHKDDLEVAKHMFDQCKDAAYRDKLENECGKLLIDKPTTPTKTWKTALQKFSADDKDVQANADCLRKWRKSKLKDNLAPVGLKWVAFREGREAVLKIGQEALKSE
jgi:hypothetical protein